MRIDSITVVAASLVVAFSIGCNPKSADTAKDRSSTASTEKITMDGPPPMTNDVHAHASVGPHHGTLVELGNEEFHAEVVHDDQSVTVYVLDTAATTAVPIDAKEITINLLHEGVPVQFNLSASPDTGDPNDKSSRFVLADAELAGHLDDHASAPKLMITINGTPYRGEFHHDHGAHDHADHKH